MYEYGVGFVFMVPKFRRRYYVQPRLHHYNADFAVSSIFGPAGSKSCPESGLSFRTRYCTASSKYAINEAGGPPNRGSLEGFFCQNWTCVNWDRSLNSIWFASLPDMISFWHACSSFANKWCNCVFWGAKANSAISKGCRGDRGDVPELEAQNLLEVWHGLYVLSN